MNWILPYTELFILQKLFAQPSTRQFLYDPEHLVKSSECKSFEIYRHRKMILTELKKAPFFLISLSRDSFVAKLDTKHQFSAIEFNKSENDTNFQSELYYCILNADRTFRFAFSNKNAYPSFLNLYNGSGLRKVLFSGLSKLAFAINQKQWIAKGQFILLFQGEHPLKRIIPSTDEANYSIFSGTKGANRKAVIEIHDKGKTASFIKFPMTKASEELLENENKTIKALEKKPLCNTIIPAANVLPVGLKLSNVKPAKYFNKTRLDPSHLNCLAELYQLHGNMEFIGQLESYYFMGNQLSELATLNFEYSPLNNHEVKAIVENLQQWYQSLPVDTKIPIGLTHGDFTPWNMYLTHSMVHLYDWELARVDLPFLYDAFHFIFQSTTLIGNNPFSKIKENLNHLENLEIVQNLIVEYQINFQLHWRYYLLFTICYNLPLYLQQRDLHTQAHWLLRNWFEAISEQSTMLKSKASLAVQ